jgi:hypothetical protein
MALRGQIGQQGRAGPFDPDTLVRQRPVPRDLKKAIGYIRDHLQIWLHTAVFPSERCVSIFGNSWLFRRSSVGGSCAWQPLVRACLKARTRPQLQKLQHDSASVTSAGLRRTIATTLEKRPPAHYSEAVSAVTSVGADLETTMLALFRLRRTAHETDLLSLCFRFRILPRTQIAERLGNILPMEWRRPCVGCAPLQS